MKTVIAILAVFLFIMGYRIYVILRDGPPSRTTPKRASDDENVINDPGMFWHPLNRSHDD